MYKKCKKCNSEKSMFEFSKCSKSPDGLYYTCKICDSSDRAAKRKLRISKARLVAKKYRLANKDKIREQKRKSYFRNRDRALLKQKKYQETNRDKILSYLKDYYSQNKQQFILRAREREWLLGCALGVENKNRIDRIYHISQAFSQLDNTEYHVDHIIPLVGKGMFEGEYQQVVSGLHVPWNLQVLTREENLKKTNKFDGTYTNESWREVKNEF